MEDKSGIGRLGRSIGLVAGLGLPAVMLLLPPPGGMPAEAWRTAAVGVLMATWWITAPIPIAATSLLPLVLFPLLGILEIDGAAAPYANPIIFLFLGGFMIARAMQRWGLHRRIALTIIGWVGTRPTRLIGGFMAAAAFLSMWVSNTATAIMMLPIGISVIELAKADGGGSEPADGANFAVALMLGIAYAASVGGMATLIGTPPNAFLAGLLAESYGTSIGFGTWMLVGVPIMLLALPLVWLTLTRLVYPVRLASLPGGAEMIDRELRRMGRPGRGERLVSLVFAGAALAWIFRPLLVTVLPGLSDAGIAMTAAVLLFLLPADAGEGVAVLDWEWAKGIPWDVLILFGGGLSLAAAITRSGLADWIGEALAGLGALPILATMLIVCAVIVFLTEITSNTASAAAFLPVLVALAIGVGENPLLLAVPAALAASCAFMLPVATPPNAIVYGSGSVSIPQMVKAGFGLNLLMIVLIPVVGYGLLILFLGVEPGVLPGWAG